MTQIFRTQYSLYELDVDNQRVRRLSGANAPTPNQPADGEWQTYERVEWHPFYRKALKFWWDEAADKFTVLSEMQPGEDVTL